MLFDFQGGWVGDISAEKSKVGGLAKSRELLPFGGVTFFGIPLCLRISVVTIPTDPKKGTAPNNLLITGLKY